MKMLGELFRYSYFTMPFLLVAQILTIIISTRNRKKFPELNYLHFYPLVSFLQVSTICFAVVFLSEDEGVKIQGVSVNLYMLAELIFIYMFALRVLISARDKLVLKITSILYFTYNIAMWTFGNSFFRPVPVYIVHSFTLLLPSILYLYQLVRLPASTTLANQPAFWVNVGILFFFSTTTPLLILESFAMHFFFQHGYLHSIIYAAYSIYLFIICKAYLCKPNEAANGLNQYENFLVKPVEAARFNSENSEPPKVERLKAKRLQNKKKAKRSQEVG